MKDVIDISDNLNPEISYKLARVEESLLPILQNLGIQQIKNIAKQELMERMMKKETINKEFQNTKFQTRSDRKLSLHSRNFTPWVSLREGNLEIINRIDWTYHNVKIEIFTPSDILEVNSPMGIRLGDNKLEVLPIDMLGKKVWQISIIPGKGKGGCFYVCLSDDKKIEIIANENGYLSGEYSDMIDKHTLGKDFQVELTPFKGRTTSVKRGGTDVFTPNATKMVDINEFLTVA